MKAFTTEMVVPDKQAMISGFFKVMGPAVTLAVITAFMRTYYKMNGYPAPVYFNQFLIFLTIVGALYCFHAWYYNTYKKQGDLTLDEDGIDMYWDSAENSQHFKVGEISNLSFMYDGFAGSCDTPKGTENLLSFKAADGSDYAVNFRLDSQEAADQLSAVVQSWYKKGVAVGETDKSGHKRYLLQYSPKYRQIDSAQA